MNYWIIDDFFTSKELEETLKLSAETEYFQPGLNFYKGVRSKFLSELYPDYYRAILKKLYKLPIARNTVYNKVETSFHKLSDTHVEGYSLEESAWHVDPGNFAGVVYLKKNPEHGTGTLLKVNDEIVEVENKFNRAVFYNADIMHRTAGVKSSDEDPRLTLTIFIDSFTFTSKK